MMGYRYFQFAQAYGQNAYNSCTYNCAQGQSTATNPLANTGVAVAGIITLACLIVLVAVLVRVWRRPAPKLAEEEVANESESESETDVSPRQ